MSRISDARVRKSYPIDKRYNRLTVYGYDHYYDVNGRGRWAVKCRCDCGGTKTVKQPHWLRIGDTGSCGCLQREFASKLGKCTGPANRLPGNEALVRQRYRCYRQGAKRRQFSFELPEELFRALIHLPCAYCGDKPAVLNGIDRLNSSLGYSPSNVLPCCKTCNMAKGQLSPDQFVLLAKKISNFHENLKLFGLNSLVHGT